MKAKKIDKIYYEMFVTNSSEEDKGTVGEVTYVSNQDRIAHIHWFQGECDECSFDWIQKHYYELDPNDEAEEEEREEN